MNIREYERDYQTSPVLTKIVKYTAYLGILGLFVFYYLNKDRWKAANEEREATELAREKAAFEEAKLGERILNFDKAIQEADAALEVEDYFQAVFHFRNAVRFNPESIPTQERFIKALEDSCEDGTEIHCDKIADQQERLQSLLDAKDQLKPLESIRDEVNILMQK